MEKEKKNLMEKVDELLGKFDGALEQPILMIMNFISNFLLSLESKAKDERPYRILSFAILEYQDELYKWTSQSETKIDDKFIDELVETAQKILEK